MELAVGVPSSSSWFGCSVLPVLLWLSHTKKLVGAITNLKSTYGVDRNWHGDPCAPQAYSWEGLNCSYEDYNPPRIISL